MISNTGYSVFATKCVTDAAYELQSVNYSDYKKWCKQYTFNALKTGHRFGQDFCMYFDITDYILYYKPNIPIAIIEAKDNKHSVRAGIQQPLFRGGSS